MSKRLFDLLLATVALLVVLPVGIVIAVLIKLDSRGPVFFRQTRSGKDGKPFRIFKFRTMVDNAYAIGPRLTQKHDARVTRIGHILRWLKLDELPQFLNVIAGDMSLVGPRPEDPHFVAMYTAEQRAVLSVRPGIVGPSQILGRDELEKYPDGLVDTERYYVEHILPDKLAIDLEYVRSCSLAEDLRLIFAAMIATVAGAFKRKFFRMRRAAMLLLGADTLASVLVYGLAFGLKFEWSYDAEAIAYLGVVMAMILVVRPPLFVYFGLYQNVLRYLGTREFLTIVKAVTVGSGTLTAATFMIGLRSHSRLVFLIDWGLLVLVLFGLRVVLKNSLESRRARSGERCRNVLIAGAEDTGPQLAMAMATRQGAAYRPVGFLDDDPSRQGTVINGVRVLGTVAELPVVATLHAIDVVMVPFPEIPSASLRRIVEYCRGHGIEYRLVPSLDRLLSGHLTIPEASELGFGEPLVPTAANGNGNGSAAIPPSAAPGGSDPVRSAPMVATRSAERLVLVTGGAGYIGSHVVRKLLDRGRRVRVLDNYLYGDHGLRDIAGHPRLEIVEGDIRHLRSMTLAARGAQAVIALAALVGDAACDLDVDETVSTNKEATRLLADVCERAGVQRLVFASSCSVYGANSDLVLNEGSWLNPVSLYARTRIESEEELLRRTDRLSITVLRLSTVFGWSKRMRLDLVVNTFAAHAFFNGRIKVFGGDQWRPNLHVQDAAEAFIRASEADDTTVRGEIFNVGNNRLNYTIREIADTVKRAWPRTDVEVIETAQDRRDYRVSFDKVQHVLGFSTAFTVEDGVKEMINAFNAGALSTPDAERYNNLKFLKRHGFGGVRVPPELVPSEAA